MTEPLDPLRLPLQGSRLIEASAGTGKTWTIAALYLRLVLGHGGALPPLLPAQILVMSFTRAATRELAARIRDRLLQAAACFRGAPLPQGDVFLAALLDAHGGERRAAGAWRLAAAAEAMDDAAVLTIDAWCQRMLREHAFDSGCLFDEELQADTTPLRAEAVRDYWRQQVYPLGGDTLATVLHTWRDVGVLQRTVRELQDVPLPPGCGAGSLAGVVAQVVAERAQALAALKAGWVERAETMRDWLDAQTATGGGPFDKRRLRPTDFRGWLGRLRAWALDPQADDPGLSDTAAERLTPAGLRKALKPGATIDPPAGFTAFAELMAALPNLPAPGPALRLHAAARVADRLQQLKAESGRFGFADMLQRLDDALDASRHGERARRLRERILLQYPAALIDEFQDTSPVQLSIFDRLYRITDDSPARLLLLIGDPKQAIYAFRGADILSYLGARRATAGRHHVLGTNHRSSAALVAAVNAIFGAAERRDADGAFGFAAELPFEPVAARGRPERFVAGGVEVPALQFCLDAERRSVEDSQAVLAALCAEHIVQRLNDPGAGFQHPDAPWQRLRPADIAVLVRSGVEAGAVRRALRRRGLASVYLSDRDSVFASDEAADLLRLLRALAAPRDLRLARAALATTLVGASLAELRALAGADEAFDARCALLAQWHAVWQAQGVLAMLRRALHGLALPARWLARDDDGVGERRLTNLLHLAELLQAESARVDGEQALIRWLAQEIEGAAGGDTPGADEQVLRLESDADRVQIVTVHKSKGLEYPLVYLPFAAHARPQERRNTPFVQPADAAGRRTLVLAPDPSQLAAADRERLREDLRLLYVALTRARHALWLGVGVLPHGQRKASALWPASALGQLLSGGAARDPAQIEADLRHLADTVAGVEVAPAALPADVGAALAACRATRLLPRAAPPVLAAAPVYGGEFDRSWSIGSYSSLVRDMKTVPAEPPTRRLRDDEPDAGPDPGAAAVADDLPWHRFPRGALAGNFLHGQLEWLAGEAFALDTSAALQAALRRRCERQGWGHRSDDVVAWLRRVCSAPLWAAGAAGPCTLASLKTTLPEMEFWLPVDALAARRVDALCRQHVLPGQPRPPLAERTLRGLLMGFADLVYEHEGRFGVLDHKSNALGVRDADYTPAALADAVLAHRYDVQAVLYLLALQRLLRLRLGAAYDGRRHLHGAVVLFLRGVGSAGAGHGGWHLAPPLALLDALEAELATGAAGAGR